MERASRNGSTVVDISMTFPSFKPVSLFLSRFPLSKTPKQVFFNPINIFDTFTTLYYCFYNYTFSFNVKIFITESVIIHVRGDRPTLLLDNDTILIDSNVLVGTTHIEIMNVSNTSIFATTYFIEVINNSK